MVHPITSGSHIFSLWHKTGPHSAPTTTPAFVLLLFQQTSLCRDRGVYQQWNTQTQPQSACGSWAATAVSQDGETPTHREDKISIFRLPFLPHSPTSVPEWHLAVASLHSCGILTPDKFQPCQGLEYLVVQKPGESVSNSFYAPCRSEKAVKLRGRGSRSSHYHRCCPMCCIALFCCKRLCANHLVNKLRAEVAATQKNWGASNVQLWNLDFRKAAKKKSSNPLICLVITSQNTACYTQSIV